ncbi:AMP-dependent synthetase/ligase [Leucobacter salsicius]|uniref:AMP-dependent synthetase/ligase n=1 Tax=Leucobacter salsicius TaxID=664638 RepID=UPI00034B58E4|nr:AMP-dependent synthetase/ligase [Leucobacter salsicius]
MSRSSALPQTTTVVAADSAVTPSAVEIDQYRNVTDLLLQRYETAPEHIAFETRQVGASIDQPWTPVSTRQFTGQVQDLAKGLIASGVQRGETVLIMAPTQYLWAVVDQAALFAGAVVVPVYDTAPAGQLSSIIADARPVVAFAAAPEHRERLIAASALAKTEAPTIWLLESGPHSPLSALTDLGDSVTDAQLEERRIEAALDDVATIVYTSGTTGSPKGVLITHRNLVGQVLNTAAAYSEVVHESGNTVLFLPLTHVLGRALQLICIANGMRVAHLSDPKEVVQALSILKPTFLVVVPRVLEKIESAAAASARDKHLLPLWRSAQRTAIEWAQYIESGDRAPVMLRMRRAFFDRLFYSRLRSVMGGRMEYLLSGAAVLRPDLALLFGGLGVPVIEGYGLTETTAPLTGGRPGSLVAGSVGTPLPGNEVRIAPNGEVLARGVGVIAGYRNSQQNEDAFIDGYFRTGDIGSLDETGALTLTGRLKHVIVTSTGRTISPESWEQDVEQHPLVAHATLVGNDRPYLTALVVIDTEAALSWFSERGDSAPEALNATSFADCRDGRLNEEISAAVGQANAAVPPSERVQAWTAVVLGTEQMDDFVTPTMKLKRQALLKAGAPLVDVLYA